MAGYVSKALIVSGLSLFLNLPVTAQILAKKTNIPSNAAITVRDITAQFKPRPSSNTRLNYETWDKLLENMVLYTNLSTRTRAPKPQANVGSNLIFGHTSPYRLEGNKIPFSDLSDQYLEFLTLYRQDLENTYNQLDITTLAKNEQLAYWLNLHNVAIIEQIALAYPVKTPDTIKIGEGKVSLHDAKIITLNGTRVSLRDIREKIVYQHWNDPLVIYGFFLGNLGAPSIQNYAYTGENVKNILGKNAEEFTNSLRGFTRGWVSEIYYDVQPYFFNDFETDLRKHLNQYMFDDVKEELARAESFKKAKYEEIIADLSGGDSSRNTNFNDARGRSSKATMLARLIEKRRLLALKGLYNNGTVIIEDIASDSSSPDTNTVE